MGDKKIGEQMLLDQKKNLVMIFSNISVKYFIPERNLNKHSKLNDLTKCCSRVSYPNQVLAKYPNIFNLIVLMLLRLYASLI